MSQFDLDAKARDIGLEGFNAPAELNALHVWQLAGRKATIRLKRDRESDANLTSSNRCEDESRHPPTMLLACLYVPCSADERGPG